MNRRGFLGRLGAAIVGAFVAPSIAWPEPRPEKPNFDRSGPIETWSREALELHGIEMEKAMLFGTGTVLVNERTLETIVVGGGHIVRGSGCTPPVPVRRSDRWLQVGRMG